MAPNIFIDFMTRIKTNRNKTRQQRTSQQVETSVAIGEEKVVYHPKESNDVNNGNGNGNGNGNSNNRDETIDMYNVYEGNVDGDYWVDDDDRSNSESRCEYDISFLFMCFGPFIFFSLDDFFWEKFCSKA